jgi:hypothetical protein
MPIMARMAVRAQGIGRAALARRAFGMRSGLSLSLNPSEVS